MALYKWTEAEYQTLKQAIAQGILVVQYEDKRVEYKSTEQQLEVLSRMEKELKESAGTDVRRQVRMKTSKGF